MILATSLATNLRSHSQPKSVIIGGSIIASALGIQNAWMSRAELWRQMTHRRTDTPVDRMLWNWGDQHRGVAAVEQFQGVLYLNTGNARKSYFRDAAGIRLKARPDGLYRHENGDVALLCVKCPWRLHGEVRDYVLAEVQFNAYVCDYTALSECRRELGLPARVVEDVIVCEWTTGGHRIWHVQPNPEYIPKIMALIHEFVGYLERDEEPPRLRKAPVMPACEVTLMHEFT